MKNVITLRVKIKNLHCSHTNHVMVLEISREYKMSLYFVIATRRNHCDCVDNSESESSSDDKSERSEGDMEYYEDNEDECTNGTNAADVEMNYWKSYNQRPRRHSTHVVLPSTFQHYGSFYLRMGAVGTFEPSKSFSEKRRW